MNIDMSWLTNLLHPHKETNEEKVSRLELKAQHLESQAIHAEKVASLQKRIDSAKKRIEATRPKGKGDAVSSIFGFVIQHKVLVGIVVLIVVVFIVSKSCK